MPFEDLRHFLDACDEIGELRVVEGADWNLEIGTLAELNFEREGPCLLFDHITQPPSSAKQGGGTPARAWLTSTRFDHDRWSMLC